MPESVVLGDVEFGTELEVGETVILEPIMQERNAIEGIVLNREEDSFTIETRDGRELLVLKIEMDHPSGEKAVCWEVFDSPVQVWKVESVEKKNKEITFQNLSTRQEAGEFVVVYRVKWPNGSEYEYEVPFSSQDVFKDFLMKNKHRPGRFANYLKNHATSVRKLSEERNLSEGVFSNLEVWWEDLTSDEKELVLDELFGNEDYKDVPLDLWDKRDLEKLVKYFGEIEYGSNVKESILREDPDTAFYNGKRHSYTDEDAIAFGYFNGEMLVGTGSDQYHWMLIAMYYGIDPERYSTIPSEVDPLNREMMKYAGRLWYNSKLISFWIYPPKSEMPKLISDLNEGLRENGFPEVDDDWILELSDGKFTTIGEYVGSGLRPKDELSKQHALSPIKKLQLKREVPPGIGSKKDVWGQLPGEPTVQARYRLGLTVESILDEDLIPSPNWAGSKVMDHDNNTGVVIDQKEGDGYVSLYIKMDDPELEIKKIVLSLNPESPTEDQRYWYYLDEVSGDWISFLANK
jgi:hypothetical protein